MRTYFATLVLSKAADVEAVVRAQEFLETRPRAPRPERRGETGPLRVKLGGPVRPRE